MLFANETNQHRKERAMTLTDSHPPKAAGAATKPAVFVDGGSGTTGLGIAERLRLQDDVVGEKHRRRQAQGSRRQAGAA